MPISGWCSLLSFLAFVNVFLIDPVPWKQKEIERLTIACLCVFCVSLIVFICSAIAVVKKRHRNAAPKTLDSGSWPDNPCK